MCVHIDTYNLQYNKLYLLTSHLFLPVNWWICDNTAETNNCLNDSKLGPCLRPPSLSGGAVISEDQQNIYQRYQTLPTFGMAGGFLGDRFLLDLGSSSLPFDSRSKMNKNGITRINWAKKILFTGYFPKKTIPPICHRYIIGVSCFQPISSAFFCKLFNDGRPKTVAFLLVTFSFGNPRGWNDACTWISCSNSTHG